MKAPGFSRGFQWVERKPGESASSVISRAHRAPLSGRAASRGDSTILKPNALGTTLPRSEILWPMSFLPMSSDHIIVEAIKAGHNLLSQNLPPAHSITDAATVMRFRELVRSQAIRSALERSSDT